MLVVLPNLVLLVVEVLHGLKVDKSVHCSRGGLIICLVRIAPELGPPGSRSDGEPGIKRESSDSDGGEIPAKFVGL